MAQISRCELVLGVTDGLGASHSDLGQTTTYTAEQIKTAERRLPLLKARRDMLEDIRDARPVVNPYVNRGIVA